MNLRNLSASLLKRSTYTSDNYRVVNLIITYLLLFTSCITMLEWIFNFELLFTTNVHQETTKFTTAFLFFISVTSLLICEKTTKKYKILFLIFITLILAISILTLVVYTFRLETFVDGISNIDPGRMSVATSASFVFYGIGLTSLISRNKNYKKISQYFIIIVSLISFINIITFLLRMPTEGKTVFFKSMSLQTSISFALISFSLAFKLPAIGFTKMVFGNYSGSKSLRKLIPFIVIIPFTLSFLLLTLINKDRIDPQFGILTHTIVLILLSFLYTMKIALSLNKSNRLREILKDDLIHKNEELLQFKEALDEIAIVAITDQNAVIKYVNDNFCKISEFTREEIIGNTSLIIQSGHHPSKFYTDAWDTVSSGKAWFGEIKSKSKNNNFFWTETAIVPLKKKSGYINEYMAIQLDITKRKEAEELLASKYVKELEQKNQELEQYSYIASHDLQEPLRTITSFTDFLNEEYHDKFDDQGKQIFKFIKDATGRMSSLIKNLLDYSRIGHQEELTKVDCNQILQDISNDLSALISQTNTVLEINNLPVIYAYPTVLRLLFQNLLTNAIKFSKKNITPIIQIDAITKKNEWEFSVKDNGIGIKKEFQHKIFAIFQRLHLKEEYAGTGIGLAHCQKIVNLHGGDIWVKSKEEQGSTFYFTISNLKT